MAFFNEFPHTRTYDSDLGWIIKEMKSLVAQWGNVEDAWNEFQNKFGDNLDNSIKKQLETWLADGTLESIISTVLNVNGFDFSKTIVYGDSYTGLENPWYSYFANYMGIAMENIQAFHNSGGGYINDGERGLPFLSDFQTYVTPNIQNPEKVTTIIIQGGRNDGITTPIETERNAVKLFLQYLKQTFVNAKIIGLTYLTWDFPYVTVIYGINAGYQDEGCFNTPYAYSWIYRTDAYNSGDNLHPNQAGNQHIGAMLAMMIRGNGGLDERYSYKPIETDGITGGVITRLTPFGLEIVLTANTNLTTQSLTFATLEKWAFPESYKAISAYCDASNDCFITLDTNGVIGAYSKVAVQESGWGTIRFSGAIPFPFK